MLRTIIVIFLKWPRIGMRRVGTKCRDLYCISYSLELCKVKGVWLHGRSSPRLDKVWNKKKA